MKKTIRRTIYLFPTLYMLPISATAQPFNIRQLVDDFYPQASEASPQPQLLIQYNFAGKKRLIHTAKCIIPILLSYYYYLRHFYIKSAKGSYTTFQVVVASFALFIYLILLAKAFKALLYHVYIESKQDRLCLPDQCLKKGWIRSIVDFCTNFSLTNTTLVPYSNIGLMVEKTEREYTMLGVPTQETYHVLKIFCHDGNIYQLRIDRMKQEDYDVHMLTKNLSQHGIQVKLRLAAT